MYDAYNLRNNYSDFVCVKQLRGVILQTKHIRSRLQIIAELVVLITLSHHLKV